MQVITAKDAKSRFGELLDTMQRACFSNQEQTSCWCILIIERCERHSLRKPFDVQDDDYEDWEKEKITEALNALKSHPSDTKEMKSVHATAMQKARDLVASRKR